MSATPSIQKPTLENFTTSHDTLNFDIKNMNVSMVNAIRRTILSDIPCVVFRTMPYEKSLVKIHKNTSRLNNEIIKQRMSCIPIHIKDMSIPIDKYVVELNVKNNTTSTMYITTKDFKIKNKENDTYLDDAKVREIFPPYTKTGEHILLARLRPRISEDIPGEELSFTASMTVSSASEDSCFNVASTCAYSFARDPVKVKNVWDTEKLPELKRNGVDESEIMFQEENWKLHEAKRLYKKDAFNFTVETVGVYDNKTLVSTACDILIRKLKEVRSQCEDGTLEVNPAETVMTAYDIILENEDYTIGKALEYAMNELFFTKQQLFNFVGFRKNHPHDSYSVIRVSFANEDRDKSALYEVIKYNCSKLIEVYEAFREQLP